jgi:O-antigen ligase
MLKLQALNSVILALLVLAPIGAAYIRHWVSGVFVLLTLLMLASWQHWWNRLREDPTTSRIFALSIAFFLSYLLSSYLAGWDAGSTRMLERELRLLMLAPLVAFMAGIPARHYLGAGSLIAICVTSALVAHDYFYLHQGRELGIYGPLFTGPACVFFLIGSLGYTVNLESRPVRYLYLGASVLATAFVVSVTSRSAMLGFAVVMIGIMFMHSPHRRFLVAIGVGSLLAILGFQLLGAGTSGPSFEIGVREFRNYFQHELSGLEGHNPHGATSVGARLEMIKASFMIFSDAPIFGIGSRNFVPAVTELMKAGLINPNMPNYHPHNMFMEALVSKGLIGLCLLLWILTACAKALLPRPSISRDLGLMLLAASITMMSTESALLIKNNFASLFILMIAVYLSDRR